MRELVSPGKGELQSNSKCLDSHDGYRANKRADGEIDQWVSLAVDRSNLIDHDDGENADSASVDQEP